MGTRRLTEPFFEQTLRENMAHPFHQLFRRETSMEEMVAWTNEHPGAPLSGLILHMSRCGSTLVAQQIAALECNIVASEPAPFDAMVRAHLRIPTLPRQLQLEWLRGIAAALGQPRAGERALYIKADCWHIHQIDLIRDAFPGVPWMFLYRDPLQVLLSQQRMPAAWTVPSLLNPRALQLEMHDWAPSQTDVYRARALASICEAALRAVRHDPLSLLVNYSELPQATCDRLLVHFGLPSAGIPAMQKQALRDAKSPQVSFSPEARSELADATERLQTLVATHLGDVYHRLESVRRAQPLSCNISPATTT
jgi:hypothetical protein